MQFREAIERDADDLRSLAASVAVDCDQMHDPAGRDADYAQQEQRLDAAAMELRRLWLASAHHTADATLKSPREGKVSHLPRGGDVRFGYERDLDVSSLESRGEAYLRPPPGWTSDLVLCRSGQAALACILQFAASEWGQNRVLTVAHIGAYFETGSLLELWPRQVMRRVPDRDEDPVDIAILEPVWCDGAFGTSEATDRAHHATVIDTTMLGPSYDLSEHLPASGDSVPLVIAYSSGLKLDQAGLELANVGIVRILSRRGQAADIAGTLRRIRSLTGAGLTLDELSALSAPWFMDRDYAARYTAAIFANNAALARTIGQDSAIFTGACHPSLLGMPQRAPFCALQLHEPSAENYRRLLAVVEGEIRRRGLVVTHGGSFGFRGHRFELIEPEASPPFLRIAAGWRAGFSHQGLCDLFAELAAHESFAALDRSYGR